MFQWLRRHLHPWWKEIPPPGSTEFLLAEQRWVPQEQLVRILRKLRLSMEVYKELKALSAPTPGPKDVDTGSLWPYVSPRRG